MRSRKSLFVAVAVLAVLLLQLVSCDFEPKDVVFYVWEEEEWEDGRHVMCHYDDSLFSHGLPDSSRCYPYTMHNVFCREESGLLGDTISDEDKSQKWYELFFSIGHPVGWIHFIVQPIETVVPPLLDLAMSVVARSMGNGWCWNARSQAR